MFDAFLGNSNSSRHILLTPVSQRRSLKTFSARDEMLILTNGAKFVRDVSLFIKYGVCVPRDSSRLVGSLFGDPQKKRRRKKKE